MAVAPFRRYVGERFALPGLKPNVSLAHVAAFSPACGLFASHFCRFLGGNRCEDSSYFSDYPARVANPASKSNEDSANLAKFRPEWRPLSRRFSGGKMIRIFSFCSRP